MLKFKFPELAQPVIIATKGLPCTGKSEISRIIGQWAKCPVLYIDHFLDALSLEYGYTAELLQFPDEAELLHRLSFDALCKAASKTLRWGMDNHSYPWPTKCVLVKSRLGYTFEIDRLLQLARERGCGMILIIEFQMKNEYRFRLRLEQKVESRGHKEWYKPRTWKDIEKAKDDYEADNWDFHLRRLLDTDDDLPRVTRLVLDPFDDLYLVPIAALSYLTPIIINFLLPRIEVGDHDLNMGDLFLEGRYLVVQYGEVGRYLREEELRGPRSRGGAHDHKYLCSACSEKCHCRFKYWEELQADVDDDGNPYYCGVCEENVISGQPAYACNFCTLTLHKSCAELLANDVTFEGFEDIEFLRFYPERFPRGHTCKSCLEGGKNFSSECFSCNFQTHLKSRVLPTVLNHDCHEHFLFMLFSNGHKCKACGTDRDSGGSYTCYICYMAYDIECLSLVREVEHEHGRHQHLLKLIYSRDGVEEEEAYWCDICYKDMDPQNWFYSCQNCPYFVAHPDCVRLSGCKGELLQTHPKASR